MGPSINLPKRLLQISNVSGGLKDKALLGSGEGRVEHFSLLGIKRIYNY